MKFEKLSYKTLFTIFFFAIAGIIFFLKIGNKNIIKVSATWWDNSWNYRRSITVSNSSGIGQTNALIKVFENYNLSSFVSAGKLQSDLDDIRFTDIDGNLISYYISDSTNTSVDIWAVIPSLPSSGTTIWMYYGNSSATSVSTLPYSYTTGSSQFIDDSSNKFRIKFFTGSNFVANFNATIDAFLVGGGSSMGGSGYTTNAHNINLASGTPYNVIIGAGGSPGANGAASTAFGYTANPGNGANGGSGAGENGYIWSGGNGGSDGSNGYSSGSAGEGVGQGTTTREFGDPTGTLYAGGGGGGGGWEKGYSFTGGTGGAGGGGNGQGSSTAATSGTANTGGGAGVGIRGETFPAYGGSGIIVIRYTSPGTVTTPNSEEIYTPPTPTATAPAAASRCLIEESKNDTQLSITWTDNATNENGYSIQKSLNGGAWTDLTTLNANSASYIDTSVSSNNTYQYRISPYYTGVSPNNWCYTSVLNLGQGNLNFDSINIDGVNID